MKRGLLYSSVFHYSFFLFFKFRASNGMYTLKMKHENWLILLLCCYAAYICTMSEHCTNLNQLFFFFKPIRIFEFNKRKRLRKIQLCRQCMNQIIAGMKIKIGKLWGIFRVRFSIYDLFVFFTIVYTEVRPFNREYGYFFMKKIKIKYFAYHRTISFTSSIIELYHPK